MPWSWLLSAPPQQAVARPAIRHSARATVLGVVPARPTAPACPPGATGHRTSGVRRHATPGPGAGGCAIARPGTAPDSTAATPRRSTSPSVRGTLLTRPRPRPILRRTGRGESATSVVPAAVVSADSVASGTQCVLSWPLRLSVGATRFADMRGGGHRAPGRPARCPHLPHAPGMPPRRQGCAARSLDAADPG